MTMPYGYQLPQPYPGMPIGNPIMPPGMTPGMIGAAMGGPPGVQAADAMMPAAPVGPGMSPGVTGGGMPAPPPPTAYPGPARAPVPLGALLGLGPDGNPAGGGGGSSSAMVGAQNAQAAMQAAANDMVPTLASPPQSATRKAGFNPFDILKLAAAL